VGDFRDALFAIRRCLLPNGEVSDDASPALRRIRASMVQTRESIQKTLKQILRSRNADPGEDYVTLRNDRFVIPVRAETRRSIPGVVHGASGTGQTVAILDSGVDKNHPFLAGKIISEACYSTTSSSSTSVCPGGVGTSTAPGSGVPCLLDGCEHGTHVAGIAAGKGTSFSGVARDADAFPSGVSR
jgi:subtilisin family serine protease